MKNKIHFQIENSPYLVCSEYSETLALNHRVWKQLESLLQLSYQPPNLRPRIRNFSLPLRLSLPLSVSLK